MSTIQEFSYSNTSQRKFIFLNSFISAVIVSAIAVEIILKSSQFLPYFPSINLVFLSIMTGLFLGNLSGRLLFPITSRWRVILICSEVIFFILTSLFFLKNIIIPGKTEPLLQIFWIWPAYIPIFLVVISFFAGLKTNYLIKTACGIYIDEKEGLSGYFLSALAGCLIGGTAAFSVVFPVVNPYINVINTGMIVFPLILITSSFFFKLEYSPQTMYAQHFEPETVNKRSDVEYRDDLFFTYMNFSYVIIYFFLGYIAAVKFYGDIFYIKLYFIGVTIPAISLGFLAGKLMKNVFWYIYSEMLFPVFFLSYIFIITGLHGDLSFFSGILFFAIPSILFGFTLYQTVRNSLSKFDHNERFKILDFSFIILPFPILIALSLSQLTYRWYFVLIYIITLMNIVIPGIYLLNRKIEGYKKILYFVFSLIFLPLLIITHVYFEIPLNNDLYIQRVQNFKELKSTNYNASFIKNRTKVTISGNEIFNLKDSSIRNMKRAVATVYLHHAIEKPALFMDSNQKFFKNPLIGIFPNALCIDTILPENIDFKKLPVTGKNLYISDEEYMLFFLRKNKKEYYSIVDIPNIHDQNYFNYRYSNHYYSHIKKMHHPRGMYIHLYQLDNIDSTLLRQSLTIMDSLYRYHSVFLFSNIMIVLNSDEKSTLSVTPEQLNRFKNQLLEKKYNKHLFLNENHLLSHLLTTDLKEIIEKLPDVPKLEFSYIFKNSNKGRLPKTLYEKALNENTTVQSRISDDNKHFYFKQGLIGRLQRETRILTLLKQTELAETEERFVDETKHLFELKKYTEYNSELRSYLKQILSYKEDYYFNAALRLEMDKNWDGAKTLYRAILIINRNNFDANYRLGLLSLTLQDLDESFIYLQKALKLNKKHPKTLYQMGVLMFSSGRTEEAILYLNQALEEHEKSSAIFLYLGLASEKLGKIPLALTYYERALIEDPNDLTILSRIDAVKKKLEKEKNKWKTVSPKNEMEEELDEEIPLPINKSAYDIRLGDTPDKKKGDR